MSDITSAKRQTAVIDYTNWRGERKTRTIMPIGIHFGSNEWHPVPQWMIYATDVDTGDDRWFAMAGIHSWQTASSKHPMAEAL
jgi:predicted DNA-binding transcriptional regulator YafY